MYSNQFDMTSNHHEKYVFLFVQANSFICEIKLLSGFPINPRSFLFIISQRYRETVCYNTGLTLGTIGLKC